MSRIRLPDYNFDYKSLTDDINPINSNRRIGFYPENEPLQEEYRRLLKGLYLYDPPLKYYLARCIGPSSFHMDLINSKTNWALSLDQWGDNNKKNFLNLINRENQICGDYYIMYSAWTSSQKFLYDVLRLFDLLLKSDTNNGISTKTIKIRYKSMGSMRYFMDMIKQKYPKGFGKFDDYSSYDDPNQATEEGYWNDRRQEFIDYAISTSLFLFGNYRLSTDDSPIGEDGESSIEYFTQPSRSFYEEGVFNYLKKWLGTYINDETDRDDFANQLQKVYTDSDLNKNFGIMNQFCIKKDAYIIDKICYLSYKYGEPVPETKISTFLTGLENGGEEYVKQYCAKMAKKYAPLGDYNFNNHINFLHSVQGRMIYNENIFENPEKMLVFEEYSGSNSIETTKLYTDIIGVLLKVINYCADNSEKCNISMIEDTNLYRKIKAVHYEGDQCIIQ